MVAWGSCPATARSGPPRPDSHHEPVDYIELYARKSYYKTLIAIANKHARILWAMLAKDERYDAAAWQRHPMHQPPLASNA